VTNVTHRAVRGRAVGGRRARGAPVSRPVSRR